MNSTAVTKPSLEELDKQNFLHPFTSIATHLETGPRVIVEGEGVYITDNHGNKYLDAMAGLWCVNIGWGREEMVEAIANQSRTLSYFHTFASMSNEPAIRLAERLLKLSPGNMSKVFFGNSGSDANDTNVKLIWYYNNLRGNPKKKKIISRWGSYHGVTVAAASLTGLTNTHKAFDVPLPQILHTENPHYYFNAPEGMSEREWSQHLAGKLEALILAEGPDTVAAFIAEPIMGAGGVIVPPEGYFEAVQAVLQKYDVLMVADEVICGFGRCGRWFGSEPFGIEPDIVTIAKGLTSGYVPLSGSMISEKIWQVLKEESPQIGVFGHGFTYSAHPLAAAAGNANLDIIERENLVGRAAKTGDYFQQKLRDTFAEHPLVGEIRGMGLIAAIELVQNKATKKPFPLELKVAPGMAQLCIQEGLISRSLPQSNAMAFSPPLVITETECDEVIAKFSRALNQLTDNLVKEGVWKSSGK